MWSYAWLCFWKRWLAQKVGFLSCELGIWSLCVQSPRAMKVKHTCQLFQPFLVHPNLSPCVTPHPSFQCSAPFYYYLCTVVFVLWLPLHSWHSQDLLVQRVTEWKHAAIFPFPDLPLLTYSLLNTQALACHPVLSPHATCPTVLIMPDISFTFHLMHHILGSSFCNVCTDSTLNFPVASNTVLAP